MNPLEVIHLASLMARTGGRPACICRKREEEVQSTPLPGGWSPFPKWDTLWCKRFQINRCVSNKNLMKRKEFAYEKFFVPENGRF